MAAPIGPGDWVECIDDSPFEGEPIPLKKGARYLVEAVWDYLPHRGDQAATWWDCGVDLVGVPGPAPDLTWGLYRFRPLNDGPGSSIEEIKRQVSDLPINTPEPA